MLVRVIGRADNTHQLAVIEPVQSAGLAIIDDHIPGTVVEMRIHVLMAVRTVDPSLQIVRIGSGRNQSPLLSGTEFLYQRQKHSHWDQHAPAARAVANTDLRQCGVHQGNRANGARLICSCGQYADAFVVLGGKEDAFAVLTPEVVVVAVEAHRSAAGGAVHWAFPHEGQK